MNERRFDVKPFEQWLLSRKSKKRLSQIFFTNIENKELEANPVEEIT